MGASARETSFRRRAPSSSRPKLRVNIGHRAAPFASVSMRCTPGHSMLERTAVSRAIPDTTRPADGLCGCGGKFAPVDALPWILLVDESLRCICMR